MPPARPPRISDPINLVALVVGGLGVTVGLWRVVTLPAGADVPPMLLLLIGTAAGLATGQLGYILDLFRISRGQPPAPREEDDP